jgi:hypothetical protein
MADGMLLLFIRFFFLNTLLRFPFFNPCYFDEATPPEVSMTQSHTPRASRGLLGQVLFSSWLVATVGTGTFDGFNGSCSIPFQSAMNRATTHWEVHSPSVFGITRKLMKPD